MTDDAAPTFRCPIDGRELAAGKPCPDHGIAFRSSGEGKVIASARPLGTKSTPKPAARRKR